MDESTRYPSLPREGVDIYTKQGAAANSSLIGWGTAAGGTGRGGMEVCVAPATKFYLALWCTPPNSSLLPTFQAHDQGSQTDR
ncbi:hypothetical protein E2C01_025681 [Portunus trituberculatus]|uniref:Uncharacterized protein n=1 Tax=Portunus trituberculatus TaxID=210409 RepID=A0A5B7EDZ8_PORTR|nr:hypothetical protein [Portunus trituberculatus]